jgi:DtxR family Mn-dependent transcriptional regulator
MAAPGETDVLSETMRDYLVHIYRLASRQHTGTGSPARSYVSTSALADLLLVSPPAVNRMVARLRELRMIDHEPYQGIRLTLQGEAHALRQLRLHRISEAFLVTVMGFRWHEVHEEADRISRGLSTTLADRMWTMAGEPTACPHGEPIPAADGTAALPDDTLLTHAPQETALVITRVRTRESDRLEYLAALGLVPGAPLEIHHVAPFNGPLQLRIGGGREYRIVGHNLAELLRVLASA